MAWTKCGHGMTNSDTAPQIPFNLRAIYLRESSTAFDDAFDPLKPGQQLHIQSRFHPHSHFVDGEIAADGSTRVPKSYTFLIEFETAYFLASNGPPPDPSTFDTEKAVARIKARFAADYLLAPGAPLLSESKVQAWGGSTAMVHTWPYWREYCHSTMMRMNMPVILAPMMVIQPPLEQIPAESNAPTNVASKGKPKLRKAATKK